LEKLQGPLTALGWLESAPSLLSAPPDVATKVLREQATIERDIGKSEDADRDFSRALDIALRTGQAGMAANVRVRRAEVLIRLRRPEEAEQSLREAEQYVQESHDHRLDPYILHYHGEALLARNRFEEALTPLGQSAAQFLAAKNYAFTALLLISEARCYEKLGNIDKALELYRQAHDMAAPGDRYLEVGYSGNIYYEQRDFPKAAQAYREAAALAEGRDQMYYSRWLVNLAATLIEQGNWPEAERVNGDVLSLGAESAPQARRQAQVNLGRIEAHRRNYGKSEQVLAEVAREREGDLAPVFDAYAALAGLCAEMGRPEDARRRFDEALAMADETSAGLREDENKLSYLSSLIDLNRGYVDFLMERKDEARAFAVAESSRARMLRERLDLEGARPRSHSVSEYQAAARASGVTFLSFWIGPKRSYLWAISAAGLTTHRLPAEDEIRSLVDKYQNAVERGDTLNASERTAGEKLFRLLLAQNAGVLRPKGRYLIVPDGPLYSLNLETLPTTDTPGHYWIEDATVAVAPSLDMLVGQRGKHSRGRSVLLVGDALEWSSEYPKLPHARQEIEGIEASFASEERKVLVGAEATPASYRRSQPDQYAYIQFTAHATANKNSPFDSAIILSRGEGGGKLSVKEVLETRVHAELVTISACHSAGAHTYWGEGLVGFTWAFLQSGAHGVIAGLWDVSDYSSPALMHDLYAGLAASERPAEALRAAKLHMIESHGKYSAPYYWGAFQLYEGTL
jgi:CHAT domain-containing protein/Flp pilus assembly protein TadD